MSWKDDGKGGLALDNGAPVWVDGDGVEKRVDYEAMTKRLAEVTKESIERVPHARGDKPGDHARSSLRMYFSAPVGIPTNLGAEFSGRRIA